ncbi:MAG TPA: hypothetical protein VG246_03020 [Acidimicrobiales bacterium]|nr:hypothetical protein [Acidimicrobiales bacterium]
MAVVHNTTLVPSKLELLAPWLPTQPWYRSAGPAELSRAGGFRLDDPAGEVGIELMVVNDASGVNPMSYFTPLTYRGAPLSGADSHLIGTTEHGVLGRRWVYDGVHDVVCVDQVLALLSGNVVAQDQNDSNTVDPTVTRELSVAGGFSRSDATAIESSATATVARGLTLSNGPVALHVVRALDSAANESPQAGSIGEIVAGWTTIGGEARRGIFAFVTQD